LPDTLDDKTIAELQGFLPDLTAGYNLIRSRGDGKVRDIRCAAASLATHGYSASSIPADVFRLMESFKRCSKKDCWRASGFW
jgi:hypothetical protein